MGNDVGANIAAIFERRRAILIALCIEYAGRVLTEFRKRQPPDVFGSYTAAKEGESTSSWLKKNASRQIGSGDYWTNRTASAARSVFSDAIIENDEVGFFIAHLVEYGVYLEMANDRKHEALRLLIEEFYPLFRKDLAELYGDTA